MIWRVRFAIGGGHVHCRLSCAKERNQTFATCGDFVVCKGAEFASLLQAMPGVEFIAADDREGIKEACEG